MSYETQNLLVADGINYEYVYFKATDDKKPTFLFIHGFPGSLYSWRHEIDYFSPQGYGCLAPNLMGYGKTYSPTDKNEYKTKSMVAHLIALLDHLKLNKVIVLGHDWGSRPSSRFALYHPDRTLGLILFDVGYMPPGKFDYEQVLQGTKQAFGYELFGYWEFFNSPDAAQLIENNPESFMDLCFTNDPNLLKTDFAPVGKIREWITNKKRATRATYISDKDYELIRQYITHNMQAKLNWYSSAMSNVDLDDEKVLDPNIICPVLFVAALKDRVSLPQLYADQGKYIKQLDTAELETSHWVMEEKPDEVNQTIEKWIKKVKIN